MQKIEAEVQEMAVAEERRQKQERKNNIINCAGREETNINSQQEVNKIFETIEVDVR
jgi:nitrate/TMAO reductase-like tetraheme cytochrome c subunit